MPGPSHLGAEGLAGCDALDELGANLWTTLGAGFNFPFCIDWAFAGAGS